MGEHWLKVGALLQPEFDAEHPAVLIYADIGARPTLLGVAYALVTHGDSEPLYAPPDGPSNGTSTAGSCRTRRRQVRELDSPGPTATHIWVMHVWTNLANPDGQLAAENWALPFVRAGVAVPPDVDAPAGHALSLAVGGDAFLRDALTDTGMRTSNNAARVDSVIAAAKSRVARSVTRGVDLGELREAWSGLASGLERVVGTDVMSVVGASHNNTHGGMHP